MEENRLSHRIPSRARNICHGCVVLVAPLRPYSHQPAYASSTYLISMSLARVFWALANTSLPAAPTDTYNLLRLELTSKALARAATPASPILTLWMTSTARLVLTSKALA